MTVLEDPLSLRYLGWCTQEGTPPNTVRRRAMTLRSIGNAGSATREEVEAWWRSRADRAPATRATDLANLRTFFAWCQVWEHRRDDPTRRLRAPKVSRGMPRAIGEHDLDKLLAAYRAGDPPVFRAILLGADAGLRVAEAAAVTWGGIDQIDRHITVMGKGGKTRRVPLEPETLEDLAPAGDAEASVVTGTVEAYTPDQLQHRVNRAIRRAGIDATFHQLRHRFGTLAYRAEKDLLAVSRLMGHASMETTKVYAAAADEQSQRITRAIVRARRGETPAPDERGRRG